MTSARCLICNAWMSPELDVACSIECWREWRRMVDAAASRSRTFLDYVKARP